ncbi:dihydroorotate dehydrogenase B (NAD(+)), catalytic subunit [bacterium BMS3Abin02]|nr:dihydroorotate dehydrogenase B (NAD(+)), catalytic subunit [bacterium BMS3Abin02]HDL49961.1 dihydroorotate dehydrogenase [Actinomycetota bacterium]
MTSSLDTTTRLGPLLLDTPLIAAAGTFGAVVDFVAVAALEAYGAAVAKSVSVEPWPGRPAPRVGSVGTGMLNGIGIQNPGIEAWVLSMASEIEGVPIPVWGSAVGHTPGEFAFVATEMARSGVGAVEINLSCPNLEGRGVIALDAMKSGEVVAEVRSAVDIPIGAKLSPNAGDIVGVAGAVMDAGADFLTLTNTVRGAGIDVRTRRPILSGLIGGYSGPPLKPISLACVLEVHREIPDAPIVGCGGVRSGEDVIEYLLAGASAVGLGSVHFLEPRAGSRILGEVLRLARELECETLRELVGGVKPW